MSITRGILFRIRKYSNLCLILLSFWLFIYASQKHTENLALKSLYFKSNNNLTNIPNHDILFVIRTSKNTQSLRMPVILNTWFQFSPETTYITTNGNKTFFYRFLSKEYHHQIYSTTCKQAHTIADLCCHSASEFNIYFQNKKKFKWLCRFDDDQYVNVPLLIDYLQQYHPEKEQLYIGKPSLKEPKHGRGIKFWFATYGGGVCFSKSLLKLIHNDIQPNQIFMQGCIGAVRKSLDHFLGHFGLPPRGIHAYLLQSKYNINLTIANNFHHHIEENLFTNLTNPSNIDQAITLGFKGSNIPRFFPIVNNDVYRMQTLHCLLYPDKNCMRLLRILLNKLYEEKRV